MYKLYRNLMLLCCFVFILSCVLTTEAACICNEKGIDGCARSCIGSTIVRPRGKTYEPKLNLPPIGDNCWCSKMLIEPATLPKTCKVRELFQWMSAFNNILTRRMLENAIDAKQMAIQRLHERLNRLEHNEDNTYLST